MDLVFDGPLALALEHVCAKVGYKLEIVGQAPVTPPMVHVNLKDRSCLTILRAIGQQTGTNEGVQVSEEKQTITLIYDKKQT